MRKCPTEAIRVRNGKATIMYERCIGCGECVKVCKSNAKKEYYDSIDVINNYKYKIAVPSSSIYGQFNNLSDVNYVLNGLKKMGFDDVVDAAVGAEYVAAATNAYLKNPNVPRPLISSSCPAIVNLILMKYDYLIDNLSPMQQPEEVAANIARAKASMETGYKPSEIGVFVITQCAANAAFLSCSQNAQIDGVISFKAIYFDLLNHMNSLTKVENLAMAGKTGLCWGTLAGEAQSDKYNTYLSADGISNVLTIFEDLEHDKLSGVDFIELYACALGCVGGTLNIESSYLARTRLMQLKNKTEKSNISVNDYNAYARKVPYASNNVFKLDDNRLEAMKKALRVKEIYSKLPQLDCGNCGAPSCMAFAEDVVRGMDVKCRIHTEVD